MRVLRLIECILMRRSCALIKCDVNGTARRAWGWLGRCWKVQLWNWRYLFEVPRSGDDQVVIGIGICIEGTVLGDGEQLDHGR